MHKLWSAERIAALHPPERGHRHEVSDRFVVGDGDTRRRRRGLPSRCVHYILHARRRSPCTIAGPKQIVAPDFKMHAVIAEQKDHIQRLELQLAAFKKQAADGEARIRQIEENVLSAVQTITEHLPGVVTQDIVVGQVADLIRSLIPPRTEPAPVQTKTDAFTLASRSSAASPATRRKKPSRKGKKSKVILQPEVSAEAAIASTVAAAPEMLKTLAMVIEPAGHNVSGDVAENHRAQTTGYEPYRSSSSSSSVCAL